ncbi:hypothetical protein ACGFK1_08805 [Mycobacterium sp. NPDC048908]|uniref:hypothetical protein n=1 Tax=Mycobacterium sp. NPDC048908 TaxID=3364292 RepID=UPI0037227952
MLVPAQRSPMTVASSIATIARLSEGRLRACFGTGFTARRAIGQRPWKLSALKTLWRPSGRCLPGKPQCPMVPPCA